MSFIRPFVEAREALEVEPEADLRVLKKAYRQKVAEHPPDQDPEGFRRVREAYELLSDPITHGMDKLMRARPFVPPPNLPKREEKEPLPPDLHELLLRRAAEQVSVEDLLGDV